MIMPTCDLLLQPFGLSSVQPVEGIAIIIIIIIEFILSNMNMKDKESFFNEVVAIY